MTEIKAEITINGRSYSCVHTVSDAMTMTWNMERLIKSTVEELYETLYKQIRADGIFGKGEKHGS